MNCQQYYNIEIFIGIGAELRLICRNNNVNFVLEECLAHCALEEEND